MELTATNAEVEAIVAHTMNILEKEYGVDQLGDFGMPTVYEITESIQDNWEELNAD